MRFIFDFSQDFTGFFSPERRSVLETASFTFASLIHTDVTVQLRIVGPPSGPAVARAFPLPLPRIDFAPRNDWYVGPNPPYSATDLLTVVTHELCHVLGFGMVDGWRAKVVDGKFTGTFASQLYGGPVPLSADGKHWAEGLHCQGLPVLMDSSSGGRQLLAALDWLGLLDLGYDDHMSRYLRRLYVQFLGRQPDEAGLAWWYVTWGKKSPTAIAAMFLSSPETIQRAAGLYQ